MEGAGLTGPQSSPIPLHAALDAATGPAGRDAGVVEALNRLLVESVQDYAIFAVTVDGRVATWNTGAERLKGYAAAEIVGRPLHAFYPPEARGPDGVAARALTLLEEAARDGRTEDEGWRVRKDGTRFWANVVITALRDEAGALVGFAKVTRDLTARRAAEEYARQLAAEQAAREAAERAEVETRLLSHRLQEQAVELEAQTEEAQSLAEELEEANAQLQQQAAEAEHARDVALSAQRLADELQARYRKLFEASPLPSWTVDLETLAVLDANEAAVARYGYTRDEFRALTLRELRDPVSLPDLPGSIAQVAAEGRFRGVVAHRTKQGERLDVELTARAIVHDGRPAMVVVLFDVTERLRAEARQRFLVQASELLAESLDYDATLSRIVRLAVPTLADWAAYNTLDGEYVRTVAIHHPDPAMERLARDIDARYPMRADADAGVARVIATGVPELIPEIPDEVLRAVSYDEAHYAQLRSIGFRSLINVPLVARGRVLGSLGFATGDSGRRFGAEDLAFAEELGRRAGMALDNALHFRSEQAARARAELGFERVGRLQHLAAAVSGAVDLEAVARLVVAETRAALGADAVYLARRVPDEDVLELVRGEGFPYAVDEMRQRFALDLPVPGAHVVRTREPLWLESPAERDRRFPGLAGTPIARAFGASATLPLMAGGAAIGSLGVYFTAPRDFGADDRAFLSALAEHVALALGRVRLFEAEHRARDRAEALQRVTATLAEARAVADVGHLFSRELTTVLGADTAWVGVVTPDGGAVEALGWTGYSAETAAHWERLPLDARVALADAVRTGRPQWWGSRESLVEAYPARADVIRAAAQESVAILPLLDDGAAATDDGGRAAGRAVGGIVVGFRDRQPFDADARAFLVALAQQCAQAILRARAYEAERAARAEADAARVRAEQLQALTAALARAVTAEAVVEAAVGEAGRVVGSASGALALLDADGQMFTLVPGPGMPADVAAAWQRFPNTGSGSAAEAVRTLQPSYSRTRAEFAARSPELAALAERLGLGANVALPLIIAEGGAHQRVLGILAFTFAEPRAFDGEEDAFLRAVADQCAQALERARLYEAEQAARAAAESANAAKSQFLSTMSHELRTPLNAIQGYAELLTLGLRGPLTAPQQQDLERIRRANQHLMALVNDVLNFARLDAGQIEFRLGDVELAPLVADLEPLVAPQLAAKGLAFTHDAGAPDASGRSPVVHADPEKLRQVLLNLLTNAIKFTSPGGHVALTCERDPDARVMRIRVRDSGRGIPEDQLERIFEPFVQVDRHRTHESQQGVGLGLAISRDLARGMGGDLTAQSVVGEGSTFTLVLGLA